MEVAPHYTLLTLLTLFTLSEQKVGVGDGLDTG